jgi:Ca2+/Na+ antiporter
MMCLSTVSGLSGSKETAQSQILIGMGLLAGSTVLLLTILWGTCIIVGKSDLSENSTSLDLQDTRGFSLTSKSVLLLCQFYYYFGDIFHYHLFFFFFGITSF